MDTLLQEVVTGCPEEEGTVLPIAMATGPQEEAGMDLQAGAVKNLPEEEAVMALQTEVAMVRPVEEAKVLLTVLQQQAGKHHGTMDRSLPSKSNSNPINFRHGTVTTIPRYSTSSRFKR